MTCVYRFADETPAEDLEARGACLLFLNVATNDSAQPHCRATKCGSGSTIATGCLADSTSQLRLTTHIVNIVKLCYSA